MWGEVVAYAVRQTRALARDGIGTSMLDDRLTSVRYRNFMSFADEEVELGNLVVLGGPERSG